MHAEFTLLYATVLFVSAFFFAAVGTGGMRWALTRMEVVDEPGGRANHAAPTPRGGGLAVMLAALGFLLVARAPGEVLLAALLLAGVSFYDDVKRLAPRVRLIAHALAVALALAPLDDLVFQGLLPFWADRLAAGLLWLWFVNLYNFMDGVDEITAVETGAICAGVILVVAGVAILPNGLAVDATVIAGSVLGFWLWNRHPARIFLGDVGSIPLGLLVGYLLVKLAAEGFWQAALILPAYYLCDATFTLLRRLLAGENIWRAHSSHAYQRAVRAGRTHRETVAPILALNMLLIVFAILSTLGGVSALQALVAAYTLSFMLMAHFLTRPPARDASALTTAA